ncbi:MAG: hypothetical protein LBO69_01700 [Ignavibacteria bacterium]|jgi:predicted HicB family RNase H-like nuclease|nr:hypothetical protein [Ignavibacteria bacterium]
MQYNGFIGSINVSASDNLYFGKIEGINDLVTFECNSESDIQNAFQYAVDEHIKDCEQATINKNYTLSTN